MLEVPTKEWLVGTWNGLRDGEWGRLGVERVEEEGQVRVHPYDKYPSNPSPRGCERRGNALDNLTDAGAPVTQSFPRVINRHPSRHAKQRTYT